MTQIIAHEPEREKASVQAVDFHARLGLILLGCISLVLMVANLLQLLHGCLMENLVLSMIGLPTLTVAECVYGAHSWLPLILKHLVK